ncbi:hypothetical protein VoSk93_36810 [Vibrio owensii]
MLNSFTVFSIGVDLTQTTPIEISSHETLYLRNTFTKNIYLIIKKGSKCSPKIIERIYNKD